MHNDTVNFEFLFESPFVDNTITDEGSISSTERYSSLTNMCQYNPLKEGTKHPLIKKLLDSGLICAHKNHSLPEKDDKFLSQGVFSDVTNIDSNGIKQTLKPEAIEKIKEMKGIILMGIKMLEKK